MDLSHKAITVAGLKPQPSGHRWGLRLLVLLLVLSIQACNGSSAESCLSSGVVCELKINTPLQRTLRSGETHCYQVNLVPEQYLHLNLNQAGIDVVITVFDSVAKQVARIDRPNGSRGREGVSILAKQGGKYVLQVRSLEAAVNGADYSITVDEIRPIGPGDQERASAEQTVSDAEKLRGSAVANNIPQAIDEFKQSVELWRKLKDLYEEGVALNGLALAYRSANENQQAISEFEKARLIAHELGDAYLEGTVLAGAGWASVYVGDTHEALAKFSTARELLHSINDGRGEGISLYGIGWVHVLEGKDEQALKDFEQSLQIRQATKDQRGEALTRTGIGKILHRMNRNREALSFLNQSLQLLRDFRGEPTADALSGIGWVYLSLGQPEPARNSFQEALPIWTRIGNQTGEATSLFGLARAQSLRGELREAEEHMHRALDLVEAMRSKGANERLRTSYFAMVQDYFDFDVDLLMRLDRLVPGAGYAAQAFEVSERSRNRKLLDLLTESQADIRAGVDQTLLEQEKSLSQELTAAANARRSILAGQPAAEQAAAANERVDEATVGMEEVRAKIRQLSPQYALLTQRKPISAAGVQQELLDEQTMLLEYALGKERSYLWAITRQEVNSYPLPPGSEIEQKAREVYELLTARDKDLDDETKLEKKARVARDDTAFNSAATTLSKILLGPVAAQLGSKRLIVITQSALSTIPFAALPAPESFDRTASVPLISKHEIINAPSASALAAFQQRKSQRPQATRTIAIIADPVFQRDDERFEMETKVTGRLVSSKSTVDVISGERKSTDSPESGKDLAEKIPRLFATRWEANEIAALVPGSQRTVVLDFAANQDFVTHSDLAQYRIIHFATHTFIDDDHPELSRIALSAFAANGNRIDGFLHAHEISRLHLPADLVVLSSCKGAKGSEVKGEGLIGFAHAFMYAGAPQVLATLWTVDDTPTAEFMVRYYRKMLGREHLKPAAALRATQMEFVRDKRWQSPYFWAAFVLQG